MIAVYATSIFMRHLPKKWWRAVHHSSYALVWFAIVHAALAGTDVGNRVYQAAAMALTIAAVMAALLRVILRGNRPAARAERSTRPSSARTDRASGIGVP
jgi:DMSO/TMAO reductase YedYZ heme-binding membrane subunit